MGQLQQKRDPHGFCSIVEMRRSQASIWIETRVWLSSAFKLRRESGRASRLNWKASLVERRVWTGTRAWLSSTSAFELECELSWATRAHLNWNVSLAELHVWTGTWTWLSSAFELKCEFDWPPRLSWDAGQAEERVYNWLRGPRLC